jgi:hypothetical protein
MAHSQEKIARIDQPGDALGLRAAPSFEASGRVLETADPFLQPGKTRRARPHAFQAARPSCGAIAYIAHDGEPGGSEREHDAVATVLIIGASRGIGLETVKAALEAGHSVRAMARSARRIPIDHPKLEKIAGNALEVTTVKRALSGVDVVTQSLGVSAGPEIIFGATRIFSKATRVLVTAMEEAHVSRLICVTGFGAGDSRGHGGFLYTVAFHLSLARVYDDKGCAGMDHSEEQARLGDRASRDPDRWTEDERLSRVGRSARLDMRVHLARRRGGFPRQAD